MSAYIGPLGGMVPLVHCQEKQSITIGDKPSFFTGLDGTRTAFVEPRNGRLLRRWDVGASDERPEEAAAFRALLFRNSAAESYAFVDPLAQVTNMMTIKQSLLDPTILSSAANPYWTIVPDFGQMPAITTSANNAVALGSGTPAIPGQSVTVSAWVVSTQALTITAQCMTSSGGWANGKSQTYTGLSEGRWVSASVVPTSGTAQVNMRISSSGTDVVACPAITWTDERLPWDIGRGAKNVVVSGYSEDYEWADGRLGGLRRLSYSAEVVEVGTSA